MFAFTNPETLLETNVLSFPDFKKNAGFTGLTFPAMQCQDASNFRYENASGVYNYNIETGKQSTIITLEKGIELIEKSSKGDCVAYVEDNVVKVKSGNKVYAVTKKSEPDVVYGKSVHRQEFGIDKGLFWANDASRLAYYRMDESQVTNYPLVDYTTSTPAKVNDIKYPMAGDKSHNVTVHVWDMAKKKTVEIKTGLPSDQYLTNITFGPQAKYLYIAVLNRDQNNMELNQYDAQTGAWVKTLFSEQHSKYVEPSHPMIFMPNGDGFLWLSRRDGYNHLYQYDNNGQLIKQVSQGKWEITSFEGFATDGKKCYIMASIDDPRQSNGYAINLADGKITQLTQGEGQHNMSLSANGNYVIDTYSGNNTARAINILNAQTGKVVKPLLNAKNTLSEYNTATVENVSLKAEDGTALYGKLMLPYNFDPTKKYPVIVYLYGGPHFQLVKNSFPESGNLWYDYMTQRGFIVFTMDNRGSGNRGLEYEQATFRQLGTIEMQDQLTGVAYLKSLPYVDGDRLGVHGWSFGGFMTTSLMLRQPDVFKVGVAGGPVIDWRMYEIMYTERYMDDPQTNAEGYKAADLKGYTQNLKGRLLVVHGVQDDVVVWQHSLALLESSIKSGTLIDYFVYPTHPHNVRGKDRVHLMAMISRYFEDHL